MIEQEILSMEEQEEVALFADILAGTISQMQPISIGQIGGGQPPFHAAIQVDPETGAVFVQPDTLI